MKKENYKISGMSCAACVNTIEKALYKIEDVNKVNINLSTSKMIIEYSDKNTDSKTITETIKKAGYSAVLDKKLDQAYFQIKGISCSNCIKTIETALSKLNGVVSSNINISTNRARVEYDSKLVTIKQITDTIVKAGYQVESVKKYSSDEFSEEKIKIEKLQHHSFCLSISASKLFRTSSISRRPSPLVS